MNNLYRKIAVTSICTALSFTLVANKEAKAATITLTTYGFLASDRNQDGLGDYVYGGVPLPVGRRVNEEYRAFYEFNIANLPLAPDTVIARAIFQTSLNSGYSPYSFLGAYGYIGNGQPDVSDFEAGEYLDFARQGQEPQTINFNVGSFITQKISNNDAFVGFGVRTSRNYLTLDQDASLIIETVDVSEPVPEPTTIFGSALALGVGGWLKRKKSNQQNKTTSQH
jgi:hypothetical protein